MAKTTAERQAEYRTRIITRASLFDAANEARKRALRAQFEELDRRPLPFNMTPEERHARAFFLAHPLCSNFPCTDTGYIEEDPALLTANYSEGCDLDAAAFVVAVKEVSSKPLSLQSFTDDAMRGCGEGQFESYFAEELKAIRDVKQQLVDAGLWGA